MPKIQVHIEFDSIYEVSEFFASRNFTSPPKAAKGHSEYVDAPQPISMPQLSVGQPITGAAPQSTVMQPNPTSAPASVGTSTSPETTSSAATTATPSDPVEQARLAMNAMVARLPNGQGAARAKEILTQHGLGRMRDARPEQAPALINAFNTAA